MGKSWFYLTLWRGTPPEFTDDFEATIASADSAEVIVREGDPAEAIVATSDSASVGIVQTDKATVEILQKLEVVWIVGQHANHRV